MHSLEQQGNPESTALDTARDQQLELLRQNLARGNYPGYPSQSERFISELPYFITGIVLPDGPWTVDNHPNQSMPEHAPDAAAQDKLVAAGFKLDAIGRPLHPWFREMVTDPSIGIAMGKGSYWHWGPNHTADNIVLCQDHVLLVKRRDNGMWALPGGHVDTDEPDTLAAVRELAEETGLLLPENIKGEVTYRGLVVDPRVTAHAWPETTAVRYRLDQELPEVAGQDDAEEAAWFPLDLVVKGGVLFGSHRFLLQTGLE